MTALRQAQGPAKAKVVEPVETPTQKKQTPKHEQIRYSLRFAMGR